MLMRAELQGKELEMRVKVLSFLFSYTMLMSIYKIGFKLTMTKNEQMSYNTGTASRAHYRCKILQFQFF